MKKVAVIGAGASGLMVAGLLSNKGYNGTVFEKNEKPGKKLYITGKGRCNLTNLCAPDEFLNSVVRGDKFLRSAIYSFTSQDCIDFFENLGMETKLERGNRVFPASDKSSDVIKALYEEHCKYVDFKFGIEVVSIYKNNGIFVLVTKDEKFEFDYVVVATGGVSYKATGSDGAGYKFAKMFGHTVEECVPALCPIKLKDDFVRDLEGVSLKNVSLKVVADGKKKEYFGEMLFTDCGISGPIVLTASSYINRCKSVVITLDFKPALTEEQLDARLLRDFEENKNKDLKNVLKGLLPKAVADIFARVVGLDESKKIHDITKKEREVLVKGLKNFALQYDGLYEINAGIITSGGINLKEINPKTFESKLANGLYFVGEVLDVDALTGGYNLQIAWATAFTLAVNFVEVEE